MCAKSVIAILVIPILCSAKIKIDIKTDSIHEDIRIKVSGHDNKLVTDKEIALFNITKDNLLQGIRVELGRSPKDVFLKDPTPYKNLFKRYKWEEVRRHLKVTKTKVLQVVNEYAVLNVHEHINTASSSINYTAAVFQTVENTILSFWSKYGLPEDDIFYDIGVSFYNKIFNYENKWRNDSIRTVNSAFGIKKEGFAEIMPGQTILSKLTGLKTIILIEIEYTAKLIGNIIADYEALYGKYHFYSPTIAKIMKAANLLNEAKTTEWIEIRCYTEPELRIIYKDTGLDVPFYYPRKFYV
ncbi:uncharacterized protein LOC113228269 [Hyposmocoma kahamanoa]|uniref:uncharacterized protein LOC113228269 n=1 Tax=Hyposmocoma kahamanoa TaxID=1477025 RepID=UPI000E6D9553|nr:uncharacterized protein LOC113228269 [Hyposmocoma kahamanoa]